MRLKESPKSGKRKKNHEHCRYCDWIEGGAEWKQSEEGMARVVDENRNWIACLDKFQKTKGDTLIISKRPYNDIADITEISIEETYDFFEILRRVTSKLKKNLKVKKVYVMSICEHYEIDEIGYPDKKTSEHLHFHLIPYNRDPTVRDFKPESVFTIEEKEITFDQMKRIKDEICK